jgi:hypothetical protein
MNEIESYLKNVNDLVIVELGVWKGDTTLQLLNNNKYNIKKYYAIDSYGSDEETTPLHNIGLWPYYKETNPIEIGEDTYNYMKNILKNYDNVELIRKSTNKCHSMIPNNSTNLLYIDAGHTYEYVYNDLVNYYPKVKTGGLIIGDDYFMRNKKNDILGRGYDCDMVYEAVQDFTKKYNIKFIESGMHGNYAARYVIIKEKELDENNELKILDDIKNRMI